jgi:hypothetical protein
MCVAFAQRSALVRAAVQDCEVFAFYVEDADGAAFEVNDLALTRRNFVECGDDMFHIGTRAGSL